MACDSDCIRDAAAFRDSVLAKYDGTDVVVLKEVTTDDGARRADGVVWDCRKGQPRRVVEATLERTISTAKVEQLIDTARRAGCRGMELAIDEGARVTRAGKEKARHAGVRFTRHRR